MVTRAKQKERTRAAIVEACGRLLDRGIEPTIDLVAEEAEVSRATVYRYFGTVFDIVWQTVSGRVTADADEVIEAAGPDVAARLAEAEHGVNEYLFADPDGVRRFEIGWLQRIVDGSYEPGERPLRRLRYIDKALEPVAEQLTEASLLRLRHALALAIGSEAMLTLVDGCQLSVDEARDITRWASRSLLTQALAEAGIDTPGPEPTAAAG